MTTQAHPAARPTRPGPRRLQVLRTTDLTPHMRRITLGGPELAGFPEGSGGAHLKLFLQRPGQGELTLPEMTPDGPRWPPRELRPFVRTYTVRRYDAVAGELDVDFVLHGDNGPASAWALRARPGDTIGISSPGRREERLFTADWCLLVGDPSALPAIGAYLETLPAATRGHALVELPDEAERQQIDGSSQVALTWVYPGDRPAPHSAPLLDAVRALPWPTSGSVFVWIAGESSAAVAVRNFVRDTYGVPREDMYVTPYWKAGADEEAYHAERHKIMDEEE